MPRYAENTEVAVEKSRAEIERILTRYGADQFMTGWRDTKAMLAFRAQGRYIRFVLPLPDRQAREFTHIKPGYRPERVCTPEELAKRYEQACRQRWRALALAIKAKLEAVEAGISEFESEFLANIVLPDGQTLAEHARPLIARAYETGSMPPLLPHLS